MQTVERRLYYQLLTPIGHTMGLLSTSIFHSKSQVQSI